MTSLGREVVADKLLFLVGCLTLCLVVSTACTVTQNDRMPASPDHGMQSGTVESVSGRSEVPASTLTLILPAATSTLVLLPAAPLSTSTTVLTPGPSETVAFQPPAYSADITFPFALGNTWVYSGTIYTGFNPTEIYTATYVVTESVTALQFHPPYTVVRIHREQLPSPAPSEDDRWSPEELTATEDYWYIIEDATVYRLPEEPNWEAISESIVSGISEIAFEFPLEVGRRWYLNEAMQKRYPGYETDSMLRKVVQQGAAATRAASFEGCFQLTEIIGGYIFKMWFCPGVGIVDREADHSGTPMGMHEVLTGYRVN